MELILRISSVVMRRDRGATAIEYALIAAGIALAIVVATSTVGNNVSALFNEVSSGF